MLVLNFETMIGAIDSGAIITAIVFIVISLVILMTTAGELGKRSKNLMSKVINPE